MLIKHTLKNPRLPFSVILLYYLSILACIPQYLNSTLQSLYAHMMEFPLGVGCSLPSQSDQCSSIQSSSNGPRPVFSETYSVGSSFSASSYTAPSYNSKNLQRYTKAETTRDENFLLIYISCQLKMHLLTLSFTISMRSTMRSRFSDSVMLKTFSKCPPSGV